MARNRPRKGTEMRRGAGTISAPLLAGLTMFPVTFGSTVGPEVAEDVIQPFALEVLSDPQPVATPARRTKKSYKRRLLVAASSLLSLVAVSSLTAATTFGLFSAHKAATASTFATGTVSFAAGSPSSCTFTGMLPGGAAQTCSVTVTYNGTAPAWLGLDVFVATKPGVQSGAENLYNPGAGDNPMTLLVTSTTPSATFTNPPSASVLTCPSVGLDGANYTGYAKCYETDDELVTTSTVTSGATTFTISASLTASSNTNYQNGVAVVVLRPQVVQAGNNGSTGSCTAGTVCAGIGHWS